MSAREQCPEDGIGRRIYALRQKHGMTQAELSEMLYNRGSPAYTVLSIDLWEQGKKRPRVKTIKILSEIFNVSVNYIINGET